MATVTRLGGKVVHQRRVDRGVTERQKRKRRKVVREITSDVTNHDKKITYHRGKSETVTNYISVTCPNVAGDNAIYDSIVTADNNVTHDSDLNDNSLTCHKVVKGATMTNDKKVTRGIALDHNNGTNASDLNDNLTCHRAMTV